MITQERLQEILSYDPGTGDFTWLKSGSGRRLDLIAGYLNSNGYREIMVDGVLYKSHRLAWLYMTGCWPIGEIDHINHTKDANWFSNLREVTRTENGRNQSMHKTNTSGATGVSWNKQKGKWLASIMATGERHFLGYFESIDDAVMARKSAENKYGFHLNHGKSQELSL